ncbi:ANL_HP_G0146610.mRNA.1.CDS.1 [Saccharomyces cerevisiae]|nr:ANL_HP_G0146610.mRNA.1.CDS.1 [Saccharomyces cerevisiae]CAI7009216.1 ANL_HP_G0146610.mRNA.1.CDS.1 [Saccharomyces cerevisiae]
MHLTKHKIQYEREVKQGKTFPEFEREYLAILSRFVNECNGQISVALQNLKHTAEERMKIQQVTEELDVLDVRIGLMGQEIDSLIRADEVTMGMLQSVKLQELISKRKEVAKRVRNITENVGQSAQQKLQVCEVCGAYLSRLDTDRRLADHFLGKIHLGYVKMREDYDRLMKNNRTTNANKTATTLPGRRFV